MGQFFYQFEDSNGLNIPAGFSREWGTDFNFPCATDAESMFGGVLCSGAATGGGRRAVTPDDFNYAFGTTPQAFTMQARFQIEADMDTGESGVGLCWRAGNNASSDDASNWIGNYAHLQNAGGNWQVRCGYFNFTTGSNNNEYAYTVGSRFTYRGLPCFLKLQQLDNVVYLKVWLESEAEPGSWQGSYVPTYPALNGNGAGLFQHITPVVTGWWDYLAIGTDGDDPPTGPVTPPPSAPGANPILIGMDF